MSTKLTSEQFDNKWGATPCTDPNVLEGMAEYNRILYSLDDKEYELLVNSASEPELYYKYLHEMQEKRK